MKSRYAVCLMRLIAVVLAVLVLNIAAQADVLDISASVHPKKVSPGETFELRLHVTIDKAYHINAGRSEFDIPVELDLDQVKGVTYLPTMYPPSKMKIFSFSPDEVPVYEGNILIVQKGEVAADVPAGAIELKGTLRYQACDDESCFPPDSALFLAKLDVAAPELPKEAPTEQQEAAQPSSANLHQESLEPTDSPETALSAPLPVITSGEQPSAGPSEENENQVAALVREKGLAVAFGAIFGAGIVLTFTPCVFPMIPIVVGWFLVQGAGKRGKVTAMAAFFVLGLAIMYALLGVSASKAGAMLGSTLQHPAALIAVSAVLAALALSMFGLYEIRPPGFIASRSGGRQGVLGALLMGAFFGIVAAPCVGPFVLALLLYVGQVGQPLLGFWMFFALAIGLGVPFFVLAVFSGKLGALPKAGEWMVSVRKVFGIVLLASALYFLRPLLDDYLATFLFALLIIFTGVYFGWLETSVKQWTVLRPLRPVLGVALVVLGAWSMFAGTRAAEPAASGEPQAAVSFIPYSAAALQEARQTRTPVILDFSADWCKPCKKMESETFTDDRILKEGRRFVWIKADLTTSGSPEVEELKKSYDIKGVPTIIFIGSDGMEKDRLVGFVRSREFHGRMLSVE
jgi:thioredoxin:protein disulfide reductase